MYQFSTEPGRIERFLNAVFAERGEQEFKTVPESFVDVFYLPATDSAEFRRHDDGNHVTVAPAAAVLQEQKRGQNPSR